MEQDTRDDKDDYDYHDDNDDVDGDDDDYDNIDDIDDDDRRLSLSQSPETTKTLRCGESVGATQSGDK